MFGVAILKLYDRLRVKGAGGVLQSADDVLQFALPRHVLLNAVQSGYYSALREAITASLLDKDTGFLNAVIVLLKSEGMNKEAQLDGTDSSAQPESLRTVQQCLRAAEAKGLRSGIGELFAYCNATSTQERSELLAATLFVRCVAATALGTCTDSLLVDAGADGGCEVDVGAEALRLRVGKTLYSAEEMDAAHKQLQALFGVAAFTLDQVFAAAAAAPAGSEARAALLQLPRRLTLGGVCLCVVRVPAREAAADRRTVADASVLGGGGLRSAVLHVQFLSARHVSL